MTIISEEEQSKRDGKRFLIIILSLFFVVFTVNGFFVYQAVSTHRGVVVENAYEVGLRYNEIIDAAKKRQGNDQHNDRHEQK